MRPEKLKDLKNFLCRLQCNCTSRQDVAAQDSATGLASTQGHIESAVSCSGAPTTPCYENCTPVTATSGTLSDSPGSGSIGLYTGPLDPSSPRLFCSWVSWSGPARVEKYLRRRLVDIAGWIPLPRGVTVFQSQAASKSSAH
jgi:hypothetical protein